MCTNGRYSQNYCWVVTPKAHHSHFGGQQAFFFNTEGLVGQWAHAVRLFSSRENPAFADLGRLQRHIAGPILKRALISIQSGAEKDDGRKRSETVGDGRHRCLLGTFTIQLSVKKWHIKIPQTPPPQRTQESKVENLDAKNRLIWAQRVPLFLRLAFCRQTPHARE